MKASLGSALKGRVLDADSGRPVPNATVTHGTAGTGGGGGPLALLASAANAASDEETTTDADGAFKLDGLASGNAC